MWVGGVPENAPVEKCLEKSTESAAAPPDGDGVGCRKTAPR